VNDDDDDVNTTFWGAETLVETQYGAIDLKKLLRTIAQGEISLCGILAKIFRRSTNGSHRTRTCKGLRLGANA
jgi:hypothetical protein